MSGGRRGKLIRGAFCLAAGLLTFVIAPSAGASGFTDPVRVSQAAQFHIGAEEGSVAANPDGSFTAAWVQGTGLESRYLATTVIAPDGSVGPINLIDAATDAPSLIYEYLTGVSVSAGPEGQTHLTWAKNHYVCNPGCSPDVDLKYVNLDETGAPVGEATTVRELDPGISIVGPQIATSGTGRTGILWAEYDGLVTTDVLMAIAQDDAAPLAPFDISSDNWLGVQNLAISGSSNGTLFPVWSGYHGDYSTLKANGRLVTDDGTITDERELMATPSGIEQLEPHIDGAGRATLLARTFAGNSSIDFRQLDPSGALVGAGSTEISLSDPTDAHVGGQYSTLGPDGKITVAFSQVSPPASAPDIWTRSISPAGVLGTAVSFVADSPGVGLGNTGIATGTDGSGFLSWVQASEVPPDDDKFLVKGQPMDGNGSPTGSAQLLQSLPRDPEQLPEDTWTAFSPGGNGVLLWSVEYQAFDSADNHFASVFDASPPEVELWTPPSATAGQEVVMAVEASDSSALSYSWKVNGQTLAATGPTIRHTFGSGGQASVEVTVTDAHANATSAAADVSVVTGPTPPNTQIKAKPAKKTKAKMATFRFIASISGSKFECRLDKAGWTDCKSPKKLKKLKPGKHTFKVRAVKGDLLDKTPASYSWTVQKAKKKTQKK
ncbi:MAG: PKD domain-containing protein [Solirubrobacterales bacterium]|nr:PKD domain-containing protein [Solirubrobacterales bacterium]